jgi:DMSO/TMAO reductase YedYZ molybdopterin-dependent catalytic subunit
MTSQEKTQFSVEELGLAIRNPGMQLEGLRYSVTPVGMHYLFTHFDIPALTEENYRLTVEGAVAHPVELTLADIKAYPVVRMTSMMECAGTGRAHLSPRPMSAPWHDEAVGCAEWAGARLRDVLAGVGVRAEAVEILFSGYDRGIEAGIEANYQRSLPVAEATRDDLILAYRMNGQPLPPTHGFPMRLIVPDWYGMAQVKWLQSISAITTPFEGVQQRVKYRYRQSPDEPGTPVSRMRPHALMTPPGMPDMLDRTRHLAMGPTVVQGRAWSGYGHIERVEFSADGGRTWIDAKLGEPVGERGWRPWSCEWHPNQRGDNVLCARATDSGGNSQPMDSDEVWNVGGYGVNVVQRVHVQVS